MIPGLAKHATDIGLIDRLANLYDAARRVGVRVYYVYDERRRDGVGRPAGSSTVGVGRNITSNPNRSPGHGPIVDKLMPKPEDVAIKREHGMTGFYTTPLDAYLRAAGVKTVIITGVSANIAVTGTSIEAMNRGYRVIVPSDCVAGDPPEYVEQLLRYTIKNVGIVAPVQGILDYWATLPANPFAPAEVR
jgi:nicotinamidase-related amidase